MLLADTLLFVEPRGARSGWRCAGQPLNQSDAKNILRSAYLLCLLLWPWDASAHGGVSLNDDVCKISIGYLDAHFTVYQPAISGSEEFCEDIPDAANSVFVLEYLHDFLQELAVDFRIIRDTNDFGVFANWDDVAGLEDIEKYTVFYQPPLRKSNGALTVNYNFRQAGGYIGIVTAMHPDKDKTYHAVFYFQVGGADYGYLPLIVLLLVLAHGFFWVGNRLFRPPGSSDRKLTG